LLDAAITQADVALKRTRWQIRPIAVHHGATCHYRFP
jgi:hypothetical protein